MSYDSLSLAAHGLVDLPWWGYIALTLILTHITIASVTIFLHRAQAHRALDLHPIVAHFFRFWLWLTTGMVTKEWVAIHRKHHAKVETDEDPHSPQTRGIETVFWKGTELYRAESNNLETIAKYGHATPDDWIERNLYTRFSWQGVGLMLAVNLVLFGPLGGTIWAIQMMWIPVTAAGVINGIGHYWGYRTYACADASTNIVPWGILIGGEELHNNHHAYATSAKLSSQWYEFDIGWMYIRALEICKLATVRKVAPQIRFDRSKAVPDLATLQAVITHRYLVVTSYARTLKAAAAAEIAHLRTRAAADHSADLPSKKRVKRWLLADPSTLSEDERAKLAAALAKSKALTTIYAMRQDLASLWERSTESSEQLLVRLQDWCHRAEASGIAPLAQFSLQLRRYS
jgi:stearoyl-CoA desaturase (Delta-9 desaturase)